MFLSLCPDEDDEGERNTVPLTPLDSFFSDDDSLKQQKKKKPKKMKEGKMPKVKKRKKEVMCNSHCSHHLSWPWTRQLVRPFWLKSYSTFSVSQPSLFWCLCSWIGGVFWLLDCLCNLNERQWTVSGLGEVGSSIAVIASVSCGHQVPV